MATEPVLPEPGLQTTGDRRAMNRMFIHHAREELNRGRRLQAGEKAWAAVAQHLKIIGEQRGWRHVSHRQLECIGRLIVAEYNEPELGNALSDAYKGHQNFYENQRSMREIGEAVEAVEEMMPLLESLDSGILNRQPSRPIASVGGWWKLPETPICGWVTRPWWDFRSDTPGPLNETGNHRSSLASRKLLIHKAANLGKVGRPPCRKRQTLKSSRSS